MAERVARDAVVVTYDALPWIEQCLDSLRGVETVVVDNGSSDGTVAFVRERFPDVQVVEAENRGLGAGWNIGIRETSSTYVLLLNADAWLLDGALERLVRLRGHAAARGGARPAPAQPRRDAAALGSRLPDRLAARDRVLLPAQARAPLVGAERVLRGRLRPRRGARGRGRHGRVHAPAARGDRRRSATATRTTSSSARRRTGATGSARPAGRSSSSPAPSASTCAARRTAGASTARTCAATCSSSGSTAAPKEAERARRLLLASLRLRGLVFRGERGRAYRDGAAWLASGDAAALLGR